MGAKEYLEKILQILDYLFSLNGCPSPTQAKAAQFAGCIANYSSDSGARHTHDFWEVRHNPVGFREDKQMFEVEVIKSKSKI